MTSGGIKDLELSSCAVLSFCQRIFVTIGGSAGILDFNTCLVQCVEYGTFSSCCSVPAFGVTVCLGTLENTSYCPGMKFESPQVNELIGSSYICSELDFKQEYSWIFDLAGKFVRKRA